MAPSLAAELLLFDLVVQQHVFDAQTLESFKQQAAANTRSNTKGGSTSLSAQTKAAAAPKINPNAAAFNPNASAQPPSDLPLRSLPLQSMPQPYQLGLSDELARRLLDDEARRVEQVREARRMEHPRKDSSSSPLAGPPQPAFVPADFPSLGAAALPPPAAAKVSAASAAATPVCGLWMQGACGAGDACAWAHPSDPMSLQVMQNFVLWGLCRRAHVRELGRHVPPPNCCMPSLRR
jgi:hypothetical protein